jgi:hypothetical protein
VAYYDEAKYDSIYRREDIEIGYTTEESQAIIDDLTVQGLSREYLESLFNAGVLVCTILRFEEALMFHFPESDHTGLFVTIDTGTNIDIDRVVAICETHLDTT